MALVAVAVAGGAAVFSGKGGAEGAPDAPKPAATGLQGTESTAQTTAPTVAAPAPSPAVVEASRVLNIESEPAGASVSEGGKELCAATPCEVTLKGDAATAESHKLVLSKAGYADETLKVALSDTKVKGKLALIPVAAPKPRNVPTAAPKGTTPVDGYKASPY